VLDGRFVGSVRERGWSHTAVLADPWATLLWLPVSLLVNLPLLTAVWVYLTLLLGLDRLGRRTLSLTAFPQDLSLGLGEVGRLAFTAFWIYGAGFAPVLVINFANPVGLLLILGLFLLGVLVLFGCLQGLHRQLLAARRHHLAWAGQLYARAYEPIRSGSLAALGRAGATPAGGRGDPPTRRGDPAVTLSAASPRPDGGHRGDRGHLRYDRHPHSAHPGPLGPVEEPAGAWAGHPQTRLRQLVASRAGRCRLRQVDRPSRQRG
jgi:hypothetical protein